jgi:hypothetical protein
MTNSGALKELLATRNAAACLRVGAKPPYRLRKERKAAGLIAPWPREWEDASSPHSTGEGMVEANLKVEQDLS